MKSVLLNLKANEDISMINIIKSKFPIGSKILEISCGNGVDSLYLKNIGYDVVCTELNDDYVNNAKDLGLNCIKHNTLNKFPFKDKEFDLVYCRLGLHYFSEEELNNILKDINRITKNLLMSVKTVNDISTGKVIFDTKKWENIISKYFNIISFEEKSGILYDNKSEWIESFSKSRNIKTFENFKYNN